MIRRIRELLYDQGFTISGARNKLQELVQAERDKRHDDGAIDVMDLDAREAQGEPMTGATHTSQVESVAGVTTIDVRRELLEIRELLTYAV